MKRALTWILGLAGLLLGLFLLAIVAVLILLDPNDYREQIANTVQEQTGRELRIIGEIEFSFFPWLGLELGQLELGNAPGFAEEPFAGIHRADLKVKLLPLFRMQAEIDTIALHGLSLNLHRLADGRSNWDDLVGEASEIEEEEAATPPSEAVSPEQLLESLAINGIEILDARIRWQDDSSGQIAQLSGLELITGAISLREPIPIRLAARLVLNEPQLSAQLDLSTELAFNLAGERYQLNALRLQLQASSSLLPIDPLKLNLQGDLAADLKQQTASIDNLLLQTMGAEIGAQLSASQLLGDPAAQGRLHLQLKDSGPLGQLVELPEGMQLSALQGSRLNTRFSLDLADQTLKVDELSLSALGLELALKLAIAQLIDNPQISGSLQSNEFVPRQLLGQLGIELPEMADPNSLILASLRSEFAASTEHVALSKLQLRLDDSQLQGDLSVRNFEAPVIRYQLKLDEIDLDRYLPPPSEAEASESLAEAEPVDLPLELLRSLDIDGSFQIGKLKVMNLRSDSILKTLRAEKGLFRVHPLSANLYQGSYSGDLRFDVRQNTPKLAMNERLSGVEAGPLLKDFLGEDYASGTASVAVTMTAEGLDPLAIRRSLNGQGNLSFENGQIKGINIGHLIRQAYALYKGQPAPAEETRQTDFTALRGSFTVRNGLINTRDLSARSPLFQVLTQGDVDLVREQLDLRIDTTIVGGLKDAANQDIDELKGLKLPITVKGSFADPKFGVDVAGVLRARVQQAVEEKKEEVRQQVQEKVDERVQEETKKIEQQIQNRLFDRLRR
ncbi:MAG: AsmA family protein [Thiohalomonadaceae bacterium]